MKFFKRIFGVLFIFLILSSGTDILPDIDIGPMTCAEEDGGGLP